MASLKRTCPDCGTPGEASLGQSIDSLDRLVWHESFRCPVCDCAMEIDDVGIPESTVRQVLLEHGGLWGWWVERTGGSLLHLLIGLRKALPLSLDATASIKKQAPGLLAVGTETEMMWLRRLAERHRVPSRVVRVQCVPVGALDFQSLSEDS
jgi:hypothetical protein